MQILSYELKESDYKSFYLPQWLTEGDVEASVESLEALPDSYRQALYPLSPAPAGPTCATVKKVLRAFTNADSGLYLADVAYKAMSMFQQEWMSYAPFFSERGFDPDVTASSDDIYYYGLSPDSPKTLAELPPVPIAWATSAVTHILANKWYTWVPSTTWNALEYPPIETVCHCGLVNTLMTLFTPEEVGLGNRTQEEHDNCLRAFKKSVEYMNANGYDFDFTIFDTPSNKAS